MNRLRLELARRAFWVYCAGLVVGNLFFSLALVLGSDRRFPELSESLMLIGISFGVGLVLFVPAFLLLMLFARSVRERTGIWCLIGALMFSLASLVLFGFSSSGEVIRIEYLGWLGVLCISASAGLFYAWNVRKPLAHGPTE